MQKSLRRISLLKNQLSSSNVNLNKDKLSKNKANKEKKIISCSLNYLEFDDFLTNEEKAFRIKLRNFLESEKISEKFNNLIENQTFDIEIPRSISANFPNIFLGLTDPKTSIMKWGSILMEIGRTDINLSSFFAVQSELCIKTLFYLGSDSQKAKYLDNLTNLNLIGCWGLTEPDYGSDASSMKTTAEPVENGFIINGEKRWIGNGTIADIYFIWARNLKTKKVQSFIIEKNTKGLKVEKINGKLALRAVQNANIHLKDVFVPSENWLSKSNDFKDTNMILLISRLAVTWTCIGAALGVYDTVIKYVSERKQFGRTISSFQITQIKLSHMLASIQAMIQYVKRISELFVKGNLSMGKVSLCKAYCSKMLREIAGVGRELLGGNGILMDYKVMKSFVDAEVIYTYEGTYDINMLVAGSEITGIKSFK